MGRTTPGSTSTLPSNQIIGPVSVIKYAFLELLILEIAKRKLLKIVNKTTHFCAAEYCNRLITKAERTIDESGIVTTAKQHFLYHTCRANSFTQIFCCPLGPPSDGLPPVPPPPPPLTPRPILQTLVQVDWEPGTTELVLNRAPHLLRSALKQ